MDPVGDVPPRPRVPQEHSPVPLVLVLLASDDDHHAPVVWVSDGAHQGQADREVVAVRAAASAVASSTAAAAAAAVVAYGHGRGDDD